MALGPPATGRKEPVGHVARRRLTAAAVAGRLQFDCWVWFGEAERLWERGCRCGGGLY